MSMTSRTDSLKNSILEQIMTPWTHDSLYLNHFNQAMNSLSLLLPSAACLLTVSCVVALGVARLYGLIQGHDGITFGKLGFISDIFNNKMDCCLLLNIPRYVSRGKSNFDQQFL